MTTYDVLIREVMLTTYRVEARSRHAALSHYLQDGEKIDSRPDHVRGSGEVVKITMVNCDWAPYPFDV